MPGTQKKNTMICHSSSLAKGLFLFCVLFQELQLFCASLRDVNILATFKAGLILLATQIVPKERQNEQQKRGGGRKESHRLGCLTLFMSFDVFGLGWEHIVSLFL